MNKELRVQKIEEIVSNDSNKSGSKIITYKGDTSEIFAYKIPVEYLIFNQYNGRIGTFVKTYEKQYKTIDATTDKGEELIVDFLWKSKISDNKIDYVDIDKKGQIEVGIITKDGVIVDGNRRCMLLKKIATKNNSNPTYFRAIILPDRLEDNPKEIRKLETIYQMGARQPVNYNAIEKYLKCKELSEEDGFTYGEIAEFMGEKPATIKKYLKILDLMEKYLKNLGYEGMYTVLSGKKLEGPFVDLTGYLETHETGKRIQGRSWTPDTDDIDDLKNIYFDYIRAGFGTQPPRDIGNPAKGKGFFSHEELWKTFTSKHSETTGIINDNEKSLDGLKQERPDEDIDSLIKSRDSDWKITTENLLKKNLYKTKRDLEDANEANVPMELLQRAKKTLEAINTDNDEFNEGILDMVKNINSILWNFQQIIKKKNK
jgi:DNA-binding MarR family transcriptional regulator